MPGLCRRTLLPGSDDVTLPPGAISGFSLHQIHAPRVRNSRARPPPLIVDLRTPPPMTDEYVQQAPTELIWGRESAIQRPDHYGAATVIPALESRQRPLVESTASPLLSRSDMKDMATVFGLITHRIVQGWAGRCHDVPGVRDNLRDNELRSRRSAPIRLPRRRRQPQYAMHVPGV